MCLARWEQHAINVGRHRLRDPARELSRKRKALQPHAKQKTKHNAFTFVGVTVTVAGGLAVSLALVANALLPKG